ncbi:saccharopine dehydrogenase (NAD+, L-lysine forming) [Haloechinothrix alba]|uniref:Saccharopine dehydrogenase (NAD+, L-lysine forming) n=1 Tax=Haloechinothrix alba TaxID=664784 RepID=A0A238WJP3_9PSEU|nr:saccharopine dehydrogenase NADP-binding domain-containing protein [Haloechinothrix alba]SNR45889.1 saccharopine dehydrogenase (NAD+, L-lysine forming) [Haloechinothrix alba]
MAWMIYGASGHTGHLVTELAAARGLRPVLAGRSAQRLRPIADRFGLEYRVFDLAAPAAIRAGLRGIDAVAHCAGPFSATARPMVDACLAAGAHYLDITGEIDVFEDVYARHAEAERAGVVLLPGAGFDVVPTDCVAAVLAGRLPQANYLDLAFSAHVALGPGTVKTVIEGAGDGGRARVDGTLRHVALGHKRVTAAFPAGERVVTAIPWGDVSSAYRSTGIPNITTYTVVPGGTVLPAFQRIGAPLLRRATVQRAACSVADRVVRRGAELDSRGGSQVWGEARDPSGDRVAMTLRGPNALPLTADSVVRSAERLAAGAVPPGAHTPSTAFGARFAAELDGVELGEPVQT